MDQEKKSSKKVDESKKPSAMDNFKKNYGLKSVIKEAKKVTWLKKGELAKNTATVLAFCVLMGVFFYLSDAVIALILRLLGLN